jgi:hypothetical protein
MVSRLREESEDFGAGVRPRKELPPVSQNDGPLIPKWEQTSLLQPPISKRTYRSKPTQANLVTAHRVVHRTAINNSILGLQAD